MCLIYKYCLILGRKQGFLSHVNDDRALLNKECLNVHACNRVRKLFICFNSNLETDESIFCIISLYLNTIFQLHFYASSRNCSVLKVKLNSEARDSAPLPRSITFGVSLGFSSMSFKILEAFLIWLSAGFHHIWLPCMLHASTAKDLCGLSKTFFFVSLGEHLEYSFFSCHALWAFTHISRNNAAEGGKVMTYYVTSLLSCLQHRRAEL